MELIGYMVVGLIAGTVAGWFVGTRSATDWRLTLLVCVTAAIIGGWLSGLLGARETMTFIGAAMFAIVGAVLVRIVIKLGERRA